MDDILFSCTMCSLLLEMYEFIIKQTSVNYRLCQIDCFDSSPHFVQLVSSKCVPFSGYPVVRLVDRWARKNISHLCHLVRRGPGWVAVLQGTKFYQRMLSDSIVIIFIREASSQHVILHCIHPPFPWPPSLSLSLYPHLSHHSNIILPNSSAYMSMVLKTSPPHASCYHF